MGSSGEVAGRDVPRPGRRVLELASRPESTQRRNGRPGEASTFGVEIGMENLVERRQASLSNSSGHLIFGANHSEISAQNGLTGVRRSVWMFSSLAREESHKQDILNINFNSEITPMPA